MTLHPDQPYQKLREGLLTYEDMESQRLLSKVPNFYPSRNTQTIFGSILGVAAKELARMEFGYTYDVMSKDRGVLTPADIRREFGPALNIPRDYPREDQSDLEFRDFLLALLDAFNKGTRLEAIQEVIAAYVGSDRVLVEELYKKIGQGYDTTDRNALRVIAKIQDSSPNGISQLKTLIENLYFALDLIKPAHIGISLNTVFGDGESLTLYTSGGTETPGFDGLTDTNETIPQPVIWFLGREGEPLESPLMLSPGASSETHIAPVTTFFTSSNIVLTGLGTRAGGSWTSPLSDGAVVRVSSQTVQNDNGYYKARSGAWERYTSHSGLVSPILNRAWEVQDSDPIILDLE